MAEDGSFGRDAILILASDKINLIFVSMIWLIIDYVITLPCLTSSYLQTSGDVPNETKKAFFLSFSHTQKKCEMLKLPPPPRAFTFLRARRLISSASSSTSIKATNSIDANSHNGVRSQLAEDLQKLSRAGFVGDARARLALRGLAEGKAPVRVAGLLSFCFFSILGLMKEGAGRRRGKFWGIVRALGGF